MKAHQPIFSIKKMAKILHVSRSGYYHFLQKPKKTENLELLTQIKAIFHEHKGRYGAPRVHAQLKKQNICISRYQVEKLMRKAKLNADSKKKKVKTTLPSSSGQDLIQRNFTAKSPYEKWCSDISYLPTKKGFVYLAVILDLYSRKVVGACVLNHMEHTLVLKALESAIKRYGYKEGMVFHSDRGSQFIACAVKQLLHKYAIHTSRGKVAYDNAAMESFFSSLKKELMRGKKKFEDLEDAQMQVFEYIEIYYNKKRLHSTLGYMSPYEYEEQMKRLAD